MPALYDLDGIRFQYPENWTVLDQSDALPRSITLHSPQGGFWSLDVHPFSVHPGDLIHAVLHEMRSEYPELESDSVEESIADTSTHAMDLHFICLDFVVTAQLRALRYGHATYLLTYQAENRDFDKLYPVFQAITVSLFRSLAQDRADD